MASPAKLANGNFTTSLQQAATPPFVARSPSEFRSLRHPLSHSWESYSRCPFKVLAFGRGPFAVGEVGGYDDRCAMVEAADEVEQKLAAGSG